VDQVVCLHGDQDQGQWEDLRENGVLQGALEGQDPEVQDLEVLVLQVEMEAGAAVKRNQRLLRRLKLMRLI